MNGMDTDDWCPTVDKFLDVKYDERTVAFGKAAAKETLQAELGLPVRTSPRQHCSNSSRQPGICQNMFQSLPRLSFMPCLLNIDRLRY